MRRLRRPRRSAFARLSDATDPLSVLMFDRAETGCLLIDAGGRIVRANATLRAMLDPAIDLSPGQPARALFAAQDREVVWATLEPALAGGPASCAIASARLQAAEADPDHAVGVAATALPGKWLFGAKKPAGMLLVLTDLTPQRRLQSRFEQGRQMEAIGRLSGGIAHDFNNLLTVVIGAADLVLGRLGLDPGTRDDVTQIRDSAGRGAALVRQLLAFGRQQTLQPRVLRLNDSVRDLAALLRRLLGAGIRLDLELEEPGRMVRVDPTQLDQVLVNLLVNARDAMPRGGRVILRTGHAALYRPLARGAETIPPGRYVLIDIQDEGVGIPPDILPHIFEPFFTTRAGQGGHGLGLSTVHGIVRQSGGFLTVDSKLGEHTCFRIYLPPHDGPLVEPPAGRPAEPPSAAIEPMASAPTQSRTVLVVDDEEPVRRMAARALAQRGWIVLTSCSGDAALAMESADLARIDAVVSDVAMPGIDGPAFVRRLRERRPGLPAILVSGYAEPSLRGALMEDSVVFLTKPYSTATLAAALDDMVEGPAGS